MKKMKVKKTTKVKAPLLTALMKPREAHLCLCDVLDVLTCRQLNNLAKNHEVKVENYKENKVYELATHFAGKHRVTVTIE